MRICLHILFFAALCAGGFLIGSWQGYESGYEIEELPDNEEEYVTVVYSVADLDGMLSYYDLWSQYKTADFITIADMIESKIRPSTWLEVGGDGLIEDYPPTMSIVIWQSPAAHKEIDDFLTNIRNQNWKPEKPPVNTGQGF